MRKLSVLLGILMILTACDKPARKGSLRKPPNANAPAGGGTVDVRSVRKSGCLNLQELIKNFQRKDRAEEIVRVTTFDVDISATNAVLRRFQAVDPMETNQAIRANMIFPKNSPNGLVDLQFRRSEAEQISVGGLLLFDIASQVGCSLDQPMQQQPIAVPRNTAPQQPQTIRQPLRREQGYVTLQGSPDPLPIVASGPNLLAFQDPQGNIRAYLLTGKGLFVSIYSKFAPLNICGSTRNHIVMKTYLFSMGTGLREVSMAGGLVQLLNEYGIQIGGSMRVQTDRQQQTQRQQPPQDTPRRAIRGEMKLTETEYHFAVRSIENGKYSPLAKNCGTSSGVTPAPATPAPPPAGLGPANPPRQTPIPIRPPEGSEDDEDDANERL